MAAPLAAASAEGRSADSTADAAPGRIDAPAGRIEAGVWSNAALEDLAIALFDAPSHGLPSLDRLAENLLDHSISHETRAGLADRAFLRFGGWLRYGLIDAETHAPRSFDEAEAALLGEALYWARSSGEVRAVLEDLAPPIRDYRILRAEMLRLMALQPIWPSIDPGATLGRGDSGPRVDQLRARLDAVGLYRDAWQAGDSFDLRLETAVRRYQGRANLAPNGRLDQPTLRQLNVTPQARLAQLRINLEQRRWQSHEPGERHIRVNLADFSLEAWEGGQIARRHDVMVGRQVSSTPEFSEDMQYIVLNPWWGIPGGLARSRFQSFRRNPGLAAQRGFRIYDANGSQISVYDIDWSRWNQHWPYRMSQPPGADNPMGEVKFIFPNSYNVYIHDTTQRDRFSETRRDFSAACIRVQDPLDLAQWVLSRQDGWDGEEIARVTAGSTPTVVWLDDHIPVHINYWTVVGDEDGDVRYLNDLYSRDAELIRAFDRVYRGVSASGTSHLAAEALRPGALN